VRVAREGYREVRLASREVGANDTVAIEVRMTPLAIGLHPLSATARQHPLSMVGVFRDTVGTLGTDPGPVTATGVHGGIVVHGYFAAPTACYHLAGTAVRTLQVITMFVVARPNGNDCLDVQGTFAYRVTLRSLPPGVYTLDVVHTVLDAARADTEPLQTTVTVP
jgi:hypothetical protein